MRLPKMNRWAKGSLVVILVAVIGWISRRYLLGLLALLFFLSQTCHLFPPPHVKNIVTEREFIGSSISLSPGGDKMFYEGRREDTVVDVVMFLPTKQKIIIDDITNKNCTSIWLDNTNLYCASSILALDNFTIIPLQEINAVAISFEKLLPQADRIYLPLLDSKTLTNTLIVLGEDYKHNPEQNYHITNITDTEYILAGYEYIAFPAAHVGERNVTDKKIYSPNRLFYYIHKYRGFRVDDKIVGGRLTIYDAKTDERLAEYQAKDAVSAIDVAGWAWDSNGVYFRVSSGGYLSILTGEIGGINKLEVP